MAVLDGDRIICNSYGFIVCCVVGRRCLWEWVPMNNWEVIPDIGQSLSE